MRAIAYDHAENKKKNQVFIDEQIILQVVVISVLQ